ncbi:hypothetical protein DPMN_114497 [Dreissena polymorpha]|uniref:Sulfatase N-terminal domain-containing protein n=1 Tax=Dreissena polymorpha TaxID=45954 RepID=A0A9D4KK62_DREPO|nr:hypothetical protein DPMN_114497 [Dreissena polymorpha]
MTPLLTGRRVWTDEVPISDYTVDPFDPLPFMWKNFSERGYVTMYAEDMPQIGTFQYFTRGFINAPTDHYMRPFWLGMAELGNLRNKLNPVFMYLESKNVKLKGGGSSHCYKDKPKHVVMVDYLKQFLTTYKKQRKFALSYLVELGHEYQNFLAYGDDDFLNFFKWMQSDGHLDNTILVFFSDHGARLDEIRNTFVGRIEDRMPVMYIVIPEHIRKRHPNMANNLEINTQRLSTPFDVHQTLIDVLHQNFDQPTKSYVDGKLRSISLFEALPTDRSCAAAWIPENYCACYTSTPVNISKGTLAARLASVMVRDLNERFSHLPKCAKLTLNKITEIREIANGLQHTGSSFFQFLNPEGRSNKRYEVNIITEPGLGAFEATYTMTDSDFRLVGEIVRANKYGNQSSCISEKLLRPLCYCVN